MFDVGWSELMVVAVVAVLVVGPKDLPKMLRAFGKTVGNMRRMAGDFQRQFDNAIREAELDEVRKTVAKPFAPLEDARKAALDFQNSMKSSVAELEGQVQDSQNPVINMPPALAVTAAPAVVEAPQATNTASSGEKAAKAKKPATAKPAPAKPSAAKAVAAKPVVAKPVATKARAAAKTGEKA